ncbi:hypothetical protein BDN72DRAFT_214646 [Pluteus cervinus]|uniref:Uncharacterized protein n=1 Tax=Pluteus cervinus TaxID=181527 RepID=A0ACD3B6H1_9AGAR|nr:hypothetical protein BDN72DRAFT_214646 [Pluteus cervinus]
MVTSPRLQSFYCSDDSTDPVPPSLPVNPANDHHLLRPPPPLIYYDTTLLFFISFPYSLLHLFIACKSGVPPIFILSIIYRAFFPNELHRILLLTDYLACYDSIILVYYSLCTMCTIIDQGRFLAILFIQYAYEGLQPPIAPFSFPLPLPLCPATLCASNIF